MPHRQRYTRLPSLFSETGIPRRSGFSELFRGLDRMFDEDTISRLFDHNSPTTPSYQLSETEDHYVLSFDMPGVSRDKIEVEVEDNVLYVRGERQNQWKDKKHEGEGSQRSSYGLFESTLTLPIGIDAEKIEANHQDGVLTVAVPKNEKSRSRRIPLSEAKESFWSRILPEGFKKSLGDNRPSAIEVQSPATEKEKAEGMGAKTEASRNRH